VTGPQLPEPDRSGPAHRRFEDACRAAGVDPDDGWVGGYADYEWSHLRPALAAYGIDVADRDVLEFGCNVGGSAVVLAALGARLEAVDIDPDMVAISTTNLERHGFRDQPLLVGPGAALPFADESFDLVLANSVLEYVDPRFLPTVIGEIHRVLKTGGRLFICGTANRLALRDGHSGRLLVGWLPRFVDRILGISLQRGLSPLQLHRAIRGRFVIAGGSAAWLATRVAIHGSATPFVRLHAGLWRLLGAHPGWFAPFMELLFRKI